MLLFARKPQTATTGQSIAKAQNQSTKPKQTTNSQLRSRKLALQNSKESAQSDHFRFTRSHFGCGLLVCRSEGQNCYLLSGGSLSVAEMRRQKWCAKQVLLWRRVLWAEARPKEQQFGALSYCSFSRGQLPEGSSRSPFLLFKNRRKKAEQKTHLAQSLLSGAHEKLHARS